MSEISTTATTDASPIPSVSGSASGSMGLVNLSNEPQRYKFEADKISNDLDTLVLANYRIFVDNMTCSVRLQNDDKSIAIALQSLKDNLMNLSIDTKTFRLSLNEFLISYTNNKKTLQQHMKIIELLEAPQLVEACIRNEFYEEALDLVSFIFGLAQRSIIADENKNKFATNPSGEQKDSSVVATTQGDNASQLQTQSQPVIQSIAEEIALLITNLRTYLIQDVLSESVSIGAGIGLNATSHGLVGTHHNIGDTDHIHSTGIGVSLVKQMEIVNVSMKIDALLRDRYLFLEMHQNQSLVEKGGHVQIEKGSERVQHDSFSIGSLMKQSVKLASGVDTKIEYLRARGAWFNRQLNGLGSGDKGGESIGSEYGRISAYRAATELVDITRTALYTIIMHYNAIFGTNEPPTEGSDLSTYENTKMILSMWVEDKICMILTRIKGYLLNSSHETRDGLKGTGPGSVSDESENLDGASFCAILEQLLYMNMRLSQVGCNIKPEILSLFCEAMRLRVHNQWESSLKQFNSMLSTEKIFFDVAKGAANQREQVAPLYWDQKQRNGNGSSVAGSNHTDMQATVTLTFDMEVIPPLLHVTTFPPLAYMLNSLLTGLNFIKECNIYDFKHMAYMEVERLCLEMCNAIVKYKKDLSLRGRKYFTHNDVESNQGRGNASGETTHGDCDIEANQKMDQLYAKVFIKEVLPYGLFCYERLYCELVPHSSSGRPCLLLPMDMDLYASEKLAPVFANSKDILMKCWNILSKAGLVKHVMAPVPISPVNLTTATGVDVSDSVAPSSKITNNSNSGNVMNVESDRSD